MQERSSVLKQHRRLHVPDLNLHLATTQQVQIRHYQGPAGLDHIHLYLGIFYIDGI